MNTINNHRQLKSDETIRRGDFYKDSMNNIFPVRGSIGRTPSSYSGSYTFWRRRHTKMKVATPTVTKRISVTNGDKPVKNVAIVKFSYPSRDGYTRGRTVQVIGMDDDYLWGLEISYHPEVKYQFKKYLRCKMTTGIFLMSYGPVK